MTNRVKETHISVLRNLLSPLSNLTYMVSHSLKENKLFNDSATYSIMTNEVNVSKKNLDEIKSVLSDLEKENELLKQLPLFLMKVCAKHNLSFPCTDQEVTWFEEGPDRELLLELIPIIEKCRKYVDQNYEEYKD